MLSGGFGIQTDTIETALLDMLHKWYMFGWSYREIFRNIPTAFIPDAEPICCGATLDESDVVAGNLPSKLRAAATTRTTKSSQNFDQVAHWCHAPSGSPPTGQQKLKKIAIESAERLPKDGGDALGHRTKSGDSGDQVCDAHCDAMGSQRDGSRQAQGWAAARSRAAGPHDASSRGRSAVQSPRGTRRQAQPPQLRVQEERSADPHAIPAQIVRNSAFRSMHVP